MQGAISVKKFFPSLHNANVIQPNGPEGQAIDRLEVEGFDFLNNVDVVKIDRAHFLFLHGNIYILKVTTPRRWVTLSPSLDKSRMSRSNKVTRPLLNANLA